MPEFKPIETQEALDAIIKDRIERAKKSAADETAKKYEGYLSPDDVKKAHRSDHSPHRKAQGERYQDRRPDRQEQRIRDRLGKNESRA